MKTALEIFIVGSIITYLIAYVLFRKGDPLAALTVIIVSPFPCPPGVPC